MKSARFLYLALFIVCPNGLYCINYWFCDELDELSARSALPKASLALFQAITDSAKAIAAPIKAKVANVLAAEEFTCASRTSLFKWR
jgi:hypothetical protein